MSPMFLAKLTELTASLCVVGRFAISFSFYSMSEHDGPRRVNVLLTGPEEKG